MPEQTRQEKLSECIDFLTAIIFDNMNPSEEQARLLFKFRPECKQFIAESVDMEFIDEQTELKARYELVNHILWHGSLPAPETPKQPQVIGVSVSIPRERRKWMRDGNCQNYPPKTFFPSDGIGVDRARKICNGCPVLDTCLEYALIHNEDHGVWGGESERERRRLRKARLI